jgi:hypothetical protein
VLLRRRVVSEECKGSQRTSAGEGVGRKEVVRVEEEARCGGDDEEERPSEWEERGEA